ncbi:MAG: shikimate dehydrogenase [Myxococcales bacterium]|nr:shikimate dehydrogenase [Myxococcales bacterium]
MSRYGLLGHPVGHSRSPALHAAWLRAAQIDGTYEAFDLPPHTPGALVIARLRELGLRGANLTVPFKTRVLDHLDHLEPTAARTGAVNTVWVEDGELWGANTDVGGFLGEARDLGAAMDGPAVVVGAGGAARAVVVGLLEAGVPQITVLNRTPDRAIALARDLGGPVEAGPIARLTDTLRDASIVVVCVSGAGAAALRAQPVAPPPSAVWIDLIYWMPDPPHLATLAARGIRTGDGRQMLVHQGALALRHFTGVAADPAVGLAILGVGAPLPATPDDTPARG